MWNKIFKKETPVMEEEVEVLEVEIVQDEPIIDSKTIQEDIHRSFKQILDLYDLNVSKESEIEELEGQIQNYKQANIEIYNKVEKLIQLGLTSTPSVSLRLAQLKGDEKRLNNKIEKIQSEIDKANEIKALVEKYQEEYSGYKFITSQVMVDIMKKYTLVMGEACLYAREIPEDSLEIISKFSEEIEKSTKTFELVRKTWGGEYSGLDIKEVEKPTKKVFSDCMQPWELMSHQIRLMSIYESEETTLKSFTTSKFKMVAPQDHFKIPEVTVPKRKFDGSSGDIILPIFKLNKDTLTYESNKEAFEEVLEHNKKVLDPIACLEVEGGYIIMAAWDREADIPEIQKI